MDIDKFCTEFSEALKVQSQPGWSSDFSVSIPLQVLPGVLRGYVSTHGNTITIDVFLSLFNRAAKLYDSRARTWGTAQYERDGIIAALHSCYTP